MTETETSEVVAPRSSRGTEFFDFTPEELSVFLGGQGRGPHVRTLKNWRSQGRGPRYHKIGNRVLYRRSDVQEWIDTESERVEQQRQESAARQRERLDMMSRSTFRDPYRPQKRRTW